MKLPSKRRFFQCLGSWNASDFLPWQIPLMMVSDPIEVLASECSNPPDDVGLSESRSAGSFSVW